MWSVWLFIAGALHSVVGRGRQFGIIGGDPVDIDHVPFMVSLRLGDNVKFHFCGASIVDEWFILTAAHCVPQGHNIVAVVGSTRIDENGDMYNIDKILIHPNYTVSTSEYDAALMHVSKPIVLKKNVEKIKLTDKNRKFKRGDMLTVSGWGKTETADFSNNLLTVKVPFVETKPCQKEYIDLGQIITKRMMCAGKKGRDSCTGDSGGPLVYQNEQVGITSFGMGCGTEPGVYTRVSSVVGWISKTIRLNKL